MKKSAIVLLTLLVILLSGYWIFTKCNLNFNRQVGEKVDSLNGVFVYHNGAVGHVEGRNTTVEGYNLGLKYQCVEFVKRYYYQVYNHKMPDSYGHAKDFFDQNLADGDNNLKRNLTQYSNPSKSQPQIGDLLIYSATVFNRYGHVAIVSNLFEDKIEIIQQNPGQFAKSREEYELKQINGVWEIKNSRILGWLRKE